MPPLNSIPYELVGMPAEVFYAPVGTAFPLIDAAPAVAWVLLGTAGSLNYTQDGVKVTHRQATNIFRSLGDAGPRKVFRTEEDFMIALDLADLTLEQYQQALNGNTIGTIAGPPAARKIGLSRGLNIGTTALLLRVPNGSPEMEAGNLQYEIPRAQQHGTAEPTYRRDGPALLHFEWLALVDPDAADESERFGRLVIESAAP